jgi:hypothetical protein
MVCRVGGVLGFFGTDAAAMIGLGSTTAAITSVRRASALDSYSSMNFDVELHALAELASVAETGACLQPARWSPTSSTSPASRWRRGPRLELTCGLGWYGRAGDHCAEKR